MPRKNKNQNQPQTAETPVVATPEQAQPQPTPTEQELHDDAEIEEQIKLTNSVVKAAYKVKYRDRARENGIRNKAAKRSCWDWLAETMAGEVLDKNKKLIVERFVAILEANGIEKPQERWPNRSKGWEGRLRMTGGLALRPLVAEAGVLLVPTEEGMETLEAPAEWIAKYLR
jgi:hypothetical protein